MLCNYIYKLEIAPPPFIFCWNFILQLESLREYARRMSASPPYSRRCHSVETTAVITVRKHLVNFLQALSD